MQTPYTIILAPNPSIMSGPGTNTIVLGSGVEGATVIDPAVDDAAYLDAIVEEGTKRGGIHRILITHGHPDHIGGAVALKQQLGVPVYAFSREGVPEADEEIADGTAFPAGDDRLRAIHTPGHRFDHLCYFLEGQGTLFAGDIVAGVGTVVIKPPEGDMQDYLDSLKRLQEMNIAEIVPAHGPTITDPHAKLSEYSSPYAARAANNKRVRGIAARHDHSSDRAAGIYRCRSTPASCSRVVCRSPSFKIGARRAGRTIGK